MSSTEKLFEQIDKLLPQTQCEKCGYKGCAPYAKALANGEADINLCQPGGEITMRALANTLGVEPKPLPEQAKAAQVGKVAKVVEDFCIGCKKCLQVCPTDAIIGLGKFCHQVIPTDCTGCELCLPVCPVDCIDMVISESNSPTWVIDAPQERQLKAQNSKALFAKRESRLSLQHKQKKVADQSIAQKNSFEVDIQAAIARVKEKRKSIAFFTDES